MQCFPTGVPQNIVRGREKSYNEYINELQNRENFGISLEIWQGYFWPVFSNTDVISVRCQPSFFVIWPVNYFVDRGFLRYENYFRGFSMEERLTNTGLASVWQSTHASIDNISQGRVPWRFLPRNSTLKSTHNPCQNEYCTFTYGITHNISLLS